MQYTRHLKKISLYGALICLILVFAILNHPVCAPIYAADDSAYTLNELKLSKQVVGAGEVQEIRAVLGVSDAEETAPESLILVFRDISDAKYLDQVLEVQLLPTGVLVETGYQYYGQVSFPERITRTKALTGISWRVEKEGRQTPNAAITGISGAWFFVPMKLADPGYVAEAVVLKPTPVSGYSLRQPILPVQLTSITTEVIPSGGVEITAYGRNIHAEELMFVWTNGNQSETAWLRPSDTIADCWQGLLQPKSPESGSYRLTRVSDSLSGERLRNYPDTYLTLQASRASIPEVKLESVRLSAVPYRLLGSAVLSGDTASISRVWFYWSYFANDPRNNSSALTEAERSANTWTSLYKPQGGDANAGLWSITGVRVDFRDGWQVMFEEDIDSEVPMSNAMGMNVDDRPADLPLLSRIHAAGVGSLLTFDFASYDEIWTWGEIWLEYEQRSEAWVFDAATRQIIVYHPYEDNGYYIRVHQRNESSVQNLFLYYPGDEIGKPRTKP